MKPPKKGGFFMLNFLGTSQQIAQDFLSAHYPDFRVGNGNAQFFGNFLDAFLFIKP